MSRKAGRFTVCKPPRYFLPHPCKKQHRRYSCIRNCKGGRFYEADTENTRRSDHCGPDRFRLDLCAGTPLLGLCIRPCGNSPWHLRCDGADYPSDYKWNHPAGDGISRQSIRDPDGSGVAARQNTGFAVRDSGLDLRLAIKGRGVL